MNGYSNPFSGDSVTLRRFEPEDAPELAAYLNSPALTGRRGIPDQFDEVLPLSLKQASQIIEKWSSGDRSAELAVVENKSGKLAGHVMSDWHWDPIKSWLSVVIAPTYWRRGYGSEAARLMIAYLFNTIGAHGLSSGYAEWNTDAAAFCAALGFTVNGKARRVGLRERQFFDFIFVDILHSEWAENQPEGK